MDNINKRFKEILDENGLTQQEVANIANTSRQAISTYCKYVTPSLDVLLSIYDHLIKSGKYISLEYLLAIEERNTQDNLFGLSQSALSKMLSFKNKSGTAIDQLSAKLAEIKATIHQREEKLKTAFYAEESSIRKEVKSLQKEYADTEINLKQLSSFQVLNLLLDTDSFYSMIEALTSLVSSVANYKDTSVNATYLRFKLEESLREVVKAFVKEYMEKAN